MKEKTALAAKDEGRLVGMMMFLAMSAMFTSRFLFHSFLWPYYVIG